MSTQPQTYRVDAYYLGDDEKRSPFTNRTFLAYSDVDAERFARFLLSGWTDCDMELSRETLSEVPKFYVAGDPLGVQSCSLTIRTWDQ